MTFTKKPSVVILVGAFLVCAVGSPAQTPAPGVNVLDNSQFNGQTTTFQNTGGPFASGWNYSPGYDLFGSPGLLVSQTLTTRDLYYYNIAFNLGTSATSGAVDFAVDWDGTFVQNVVLSPSSSWSSYSFQVTAQGPTSDFGVVGNTAFWSSLDNLAVSWNGGIDPPPAPVPDSPLSFSLEAVVLLGLAGAAVFHRRHELGLTRP